MQEVDEDVFTVRGYNSLMDAYKWVRAFDEVEEIWKIMRSEGGVGINQRSVSVVSLFLSLSSHVSGFSETTEVLC